MPAILGVGGIDVNLALFIFPATQSDAPTCLLTIPVLVDSVFPLIAHTRS